MSQASSGWAGLGWAGGTRTLARGRREEKCEQRWEPLKAGASRKAELGQLLSGPGRAAGPGHREEEVHPMTGPMRGGKAQALTSRSFRFEVLPFPTA